MSADQGAATAAPNPLRVYLDPAEIGPDNYPFAWHAHPGLGKGRMGVSIKDYVRELADHRCVRCGHPYPLGIVESCPRGEWTPCDEHCTHGGPFARTHVEDLEGGPPIRVTAAQWRILTVHHLNGIKHDLRWWNLVALCQRCHLAIQGRVHLDRLYVHPHSEWFKPYAAGYYASVYLGEELSRDQVVARLDELLNLELDPSYRA